MYNYEMCILALHVARHLHIQRKEDPLQNS